MGDSSPKTIREFSLVAHFVGFGLTAFPASSAAFICSKGSCNSSCAISRIIAISRKISGFFGLVWHQFLRVKDYFFQYSETPKGRGV